MFEYGFLVLLSCCLDCGLNMYNKHAHLFYMLNENETYLGLHVHCFYIFYGTSSYMKGHVKLNGNSYYLVLHATLYRILHCITFYFVKLVTFTEWYFLLNVTLYYFVWLVKWLQEHLFRNPKIWINFPTNKQKRHHCIFLIL